MKHLHFVLALATSTCLLASCSKQPVSLQGSKSVPEVSKEALASIKPEQRQRADAQAVQIIQEVTQVADQTGLTALLGGEKNGRTWKDVDTYYRKIDQLNCSPQVKSLLKQQAISTLVQFYPFLEKAPKAEKERYADQLLLQQHSDPKLIIAFIENLKPVWAPERTALFKNKAKESLSISLDRGQEYSTGIAAKLESSSLNEDVKKRGLSLLEQSKKRQASLAALQEKLTAL